MLIRDVKVVYEGRRAPEVKNPGAVTTAGQVVDILRAWGIDESPQERFVVVHLDSRNRVIGVQEVSRGSMGSVDVHPREVFRGAVMMGSAAIVVAHNHPSGDPTPSPDDLELTRRLKSAGVLLGIPVLDHVVIGDSNYHAMAEERGW